jgi:uncharacterized protein (TIGR02466 family)
MSVVHGIFPHPIIMEELSLDVSSIKDFCYMVKNASVSRDSTNIGGWQSNDIDWTQCNHAAFNSMIEKMKIVVADAGHKIGITNATLTLDNLWININSKNCYNISHAHPGSILSGTFYVTIPEDSGDIEFDNPNGTLIDSYLTHWDLTQNANRLDFHNPLLAYSSKVRPSENMILLFPSWTKHSVGRNNSNSDRISISFNTGVKYK